MAVAKIINNRDLSRAIAVASALTGLEFYAEGTGPYKSLCATSPNGLKEHIGGFGDVKDLYDQLLAIISVAKLKKEENASF